MLAWHYSCHTSQLFRATNVYPQPALFGATNIWRNATLPLVGCKSFAFHKVVRRHFQVWWVSPPDITDITDIFDAADEALFSKILHHPNHLLAPLLPNQTHTPSHLRPRRHSYMTATSFSACCTRTCIDWLIDNWWTIFYFDLCILFVFYITSFVFSCCVLSTHNKRIFSGFNIPKKVIWKIKRWTFFGTQCRRDEQQ